MKRREPGAKERDDMILDEAELPDELIEKIFALVERDAGRDAPLSPPGRSDGASVSGDGSSRSGCRRSSF